jgi:hypothetical protein
MAPKIKRVFGALADAAGEGANSVRKVNLKKIGDALDKSGGVLDKNVMTLLKRADGTLDEDAFKALGAILKKASKQADNKNIAKNLKSVSELVEGAPTKKIADATDSSLAQTAKAMKDSDTFFKRNEKALLAAGVTAAGLGAYMLLTGESNPAKAVGKLVGDGLGAAGKGLFEGLGLGDFFKDWGKYILGFGGIVLFVIFLSFIL